MNLFTYGSLMFPEVMRTVTGRSFRHAEGTLSGWARYRMRDKPYPGIIPDAAGETPGVVFRDVDAETVAMLDAFEGAWYERIGVTVRTQAGALVVCEVYVVAEPEHGRITREDWDVGEWRQAVFGWAGVRDR